MVLLRSDPKRCINWDAGEGYVFIQLSSQTYTGCSCPFPFQCGFSADSLTLPRRDRLYITNTTTAIIHHASVTPATVMPAMRLVDHFICDWLARLGGGVEGGGFCTLTRFDLSPRLSLSSIAIMPNISADLSAGGRRKKTKHKMRRHSYIPKYWLAIHEVLGQYDTKLNFNDL